MGSVSPEEMKIEDELSRSIMLSARVRSAAEEAHAFKLECSEIAKQVDQISVTLRAVARFVSTAAMLYDRPVRRATEEARTILEKSLTLVRKCNRRSLLRRIVSVITATDFRKIGNLLEASVGDLRWLLAVYDCNGTKSGGILPPMAVNDPILASVWRHIAAVQMGKLTDRIDSANRLASLAGDNDRNKRIIIEENGILPLLKLLREETSPEAQIAAAIVLFNLANEKEMIKFIANELAIPIVVNVLRNSPTRVRIHIANLIARMAEHDGAAREDFGLENAIGPLVTFLSLESESEKKRKLKTSCAEALRMLTRDSISNSIRITETRGLLCLAKMVGTEQGELQLNCLMAILEITISAESCADLRRSAFKTNSPAAKAVVEQLLRVIEHTDNPTLRVLAIKSIGALARTFPAREARVGAIASLVAQLSSRNKDVATEAVVALGKFACSENFLCVEHSKAMIELDAVPPLMRLRRGTDYAVELLCYLALHVGINEVLEQASLLTALDGDDHAHNPELRELVTRAMNRLNLYNTSLLPRQHYTQ